MIQNRIKTYMGQDFQLVYSENFFFIAYFSYIASYRDSLVQSQVLKNSEKKINQIT